MTCKEKKTKKVAAGYVKRFGDQLELLFPGRSISGQLWSPGESLRDRISSYSYQLTVLLCGEYKRRDFPALREIPESEKQGETLREGRALVSVGTDSAFIFFIWSLTSFKSRNLKMIGRSPPSKLCLEMSSKMEKKRTDAWRSHAGANDCWTRQEMVDDRKFKGPFDQMQAKAWRKPWRRRRRSKAKVSSLWRGLEDSTLAQGSGVGPCSSARLIEKYRNWLLWQFWRLGCIARGPSEFRLWYLTKCAVTRSFIPM